MTVGNSCSRCERDIPKGTGVSHGPYSFCGPCWNERMMGDSSYLSDKYLMPFTEDSFPREI